MELAEAQEAAERVLSPRLPGIAPQLRRPRGLAGRVCRAGTAASCGHAALPTSAPCAGWGLQAGRTLARRAVAAAPVSAESWPGGAAALRTEPCWASPAGDVPLGPRVQPALGSGLGQWGAGLGFGLG